MILASASPARLKTLRNAGLKPQVFPANVDETALLTQMRARGASPAEQVLGLARAKASKIAGKLSGLDVNALVSALDVSAAAPGSGNGAQITVSPASASTLIVACDSMLEFGGEVLGKPHSPEIAIQRVRALSGACGVLHTGHWVILLNQGDSSATVENSSGVVSRSPSSSGLGETGGVDTVSRWRETGATQSTTVHFEDFSPEEAAAYVATGEPLEVAGSFTIDGLGGAFVRGIEGDVHNVVGISLPRLRRLFRKLGVFWPDLWV